LNPPTQKYDDFEWASPADLARRARTQEPWCFYRATAVHFEAGRVLPAVDGDGAEPPFGPLHVITAVQPDADPEDAESAGRMDVLDCELAERGLGAVPVVGAAIDGSHAENSRAVFGLTDDEARAMGLRFGQVAIFSWSGSQWSVLASATDRADHDRWRWEPNS